MKVVGLGKLHEFKQEHDDARLHIDAWVREAADAKWSASNDIVARYRQARIVSEDRILFTLTEQSYRLDVKISFRHQVVIVVRIGTEAEYKAWDF